MSWSLIISLIIAFLPYILPWLEELFDRVSMRMGHVPDESPALFHMELEEFFNRVEGEMSWWDVIRGRRAQLRLVRRIVLRRSDDFLGAAKTGGGVQMITPLTRGERQEVSITFGDAYPKKG